MDQGFILKEENPSAKANIFSKLGFIWMIKFFRKSVKHGLKVTDIYKTLDKDKSKKLGDALERNWEKEVAKSKEKGRDPNLFNALWDTFIAAYMLIGIFVFLQFVIFKSFQPVVLSYLIRLFSSEKKDADTAEEMYISGGVLIAISVVCIFLNHHTMNQMMMVGMRMRVAVCSLVYRKILKLNKKALSETASGQVVNLLSNDVNRFDMVIIALHHLWIAPCLVAMISFWMWQEVQEATFAGLAAMVFLTLPLQLYLGKQTKVLRGEIASRTDFRVRLMTEIVAGIQVIKMYAWEKPFEILVKDAREREIKKITVISYLRAILLSSMVFIERTALFFTVLCYVLLGKRITADKVFSIAQFWNTLQLSLAIFVPIAIALGGETLVTLRRLQKFLKLEEKQESLVNYDKSLKEISLDDVTASWSEDKITLENFTLNIPAGSLCAVVGPVGSGKSSVLQLLLGELPPKTGKVTVNGEISYASQEAWLFGASVRNNILFGKEFDRKLYQKVIKVCALETDFKQFPYGDKTKVGERGVSLSGGQRARINLARAVYRDADIYLLDDPLSAVDTHVGKHLFEKCIREYLREKTRVLVTHQLQYLKAADIIVVLNNGKIEAQGSFEELTKSDLDFTKMLVSADESDEKANKLTVRRDSGSISSEKGKLLRSSSVRSNQSLENDAAQPADQEEEIGIKKGSAVIEYAKAGGGVTRMIFVALTFIAAQVACSGSDYWVTYWTQQEDLRAGDLQNETTKASFVSNDEYLSTDAAVYVYTALIIAAISITLFRSICFFLTCMKASRNLHSNMFHCLLEAPMRFFDTNPSGRILNRFSKDMGGIDEFLPRICVEAVQIMLVMAGILVMVAISNPYMIIAMVLLGIIFLYLRKWYLTTVRVIKHIEGITKSPMFSHVNSSLNGISTIRACKAESVLCDEFDHHQDIHSSAWFLTCTCMSSFGLWLDVICTVFVAVITFSFILLNQYVDSVSGSMVGLAISQALILTGMLQYGMRQSAEAVNQMTSVERVLQYTLLDKEGPFETPPDVQLAKEWPQEGHITFTNMSLQYSPEDPPVLKQLNLSVKPGEKIGIVGRTGAGKSSLIAALFRLTTIDGSIVLDNVDTATIGLTDLRRRISIIPQEPVLFSETLRYNLDPFGEYEDAILWSALEEVELKDKVQRLEFMVEGGGVNFSLGERQLVCLARAIVRNNQVLILDEATANVDPKTDALIQATIRRKFKNCTVLTIAHRLNTIMDSDRVLVLDGGRIIEFDQPHVLLQNEEGVFSKMLSQTGPTMTQTLKEIAAKSYKKSEDFKDNTKL